MVNKMKILSVCTSIPGEDAAWWRISNIARILESNGHEVHFVHYCRRSSYEKLKNKEQYADHSFVITSPMSMHIKHLKILRNGDYDLVYGNTHPSTFISFPGKLTKTPLIFDMHGGLVEEFLLENRFNLNPSFLSRFIQKKLIDFADLYFSDKIICVSHKMIEYLYQKGIPLEKMAYVTNGIDLEFFKPVDDEKIKNTKNKFELEDKLVFGYIGAFNKWQGVDNFIEAARKFDDREIAFLIVGGEKDPRENNIVFFPKVPRTQILSYYSICDVFVLPSLFRDYDAYCWGLVLNEAMALGKPIISTDEVGAAHDLIRNGENGYRVKAGDVEELYKALKKIIKNDKLREKMGKRSKEIIQTEFNYDKMFDGFEKAIEK